MELALLGFGRMGTVLGVALARGAPGLDLVVVADPAEHARHRAIECFGRDVSVVANPTDALEIDRLEACVIASPTPAHPELVALALERGLHVFCEKPIAFDPRLSDELHEVARDADRVLQVGFFRRFSPPWLAARAAVAAGLIGTPVLVRSSSWDQVLPPVGFCDPAVSGGLIVDNGVHEFDAVEWLTGQSIIRVACIMPPAEPPTIAEVGDVDCTAVLAELSDGTAAIIDVSRNARYADDMRTEILGRDGAVFVDSVPESCARIGSASGITELPNSRSENGYLCGVARELEAFAEAMQGTRAEYPNALSSSRAMRAALAAQEAARSGSWVEVQQTPHTSDGNSQPGRLPV